VGFIVPDDLTKEEGNRLWMLYLARRGGHILPDDTPRATLARIDAATPLAEIVTRLDAEDRLQRMHRVWHFFSKVVGVTYQNDDGSDRQTIISGCSPFENLYAEHIEAPEDSNAMRVYTEQGLQIGHLSRELAADVWWKMQHGFTFGLIATEITGGSARRPTRGVNLLVVVASPGVPADEMQDYVDSITPDVIANCRVKPSGDDG
jgi:hypothetical protein